MPPVKPAPVEEPAPAVDETATPLDLEIETASEPGVDPDAEQEVAELDAYPVYSNRHRALDAAVQLYARGNAPASTVVAAAEKFTEFLDKE